MNKFNTIADWLTGEFLSMEYKFQLVWILLVLLLLVVFFLMLITLISSVYQSIKIQKERKLRESLEPLFNEFIFDDWDYRHTNLNDFRKWMIDHNSSAACIAVFKNMLERYQQILKGEASEKMEWLYASFEFEKKIIQKLDSNSASKKLEYLRELSLMRSLSLNRYLPIYVNHKNELIRSESQLASVIINGSQGLNFLDQVTYPISLWTQTAILEVLSTENSTTTLDPSNWLRSKNETVVTFALMYIQQFYLTKHHDQLLLLLNHDSPMVVSKTIETLSFLEYDSASNFIKMLVTHSNSHVQIAALSYLEKFGSDRIVPELEFYSIDLNSPMILTKLFKTIYLIQKRHHIEDPRITHYLKQYMYNWNS